MASQPGATNGAGVRAVRTSAARRVLWTTGLAMSAVVLAVVGAMLGLRVTSAGRVDEAPRPALGTDAAPARDPARFVIPPLPPEQVAQTATTAPPPAASAHAVPHRPADAAEPPAKDDVPFTIGDEKDRTGLKAFPPMGTKPIKRGIVVPDDFELPPGYVRHFQSTDDGQRLPAILMFSPDYEWVDAEGRPIDIPADRVVPPEMAPPGLPATLLEPPAPPADRR